MAHHQNVSATHYACQLSFCVPYYYLPSDSFETEMSLISISLSLHLTILFQKVKKKERGLE